MIDDPDFVPILVAGDRELGDHYLHRPLVPGIPAMADLRVGFAAGAGEADRRWLTADEAMRRRLSVEGVEHIARQHLMSRANRPGWIVVRSVAGTWVERRGDDLVASDLVDGDFLNDVHRFLACDELALAVPTPGAMVAAPLALAGLVGALAGAATGEARRNGRPVLLAQVLRVKEGQILGVLSSTPATVTRSVEGVAPADDLPQPEARDGSAVFSLSCATVEEVEDLGRRCIERHLSRLVKQDWFKGVIVLAINAYIFPVTDTNRVALQELGDKLDETTSWKQMTTRTGKPVAIRIRLNE
jgi:hypothetical protein